MVRPFVFTSQQPDFGVDGNMTGGAIRNFAGPWRLSVSDSTDTPGRAGGSNITERTAMDAQISWVRDLGSPMEPGMYRFRGIAVRVTQEDIDRAPEPNSTRFRT